MGVRHQTPAGAVELTHLRQRYSKSFLLANGLQRVVVGNRAQHWNDGGSWAEVDVALRTDAQGIYHIVSAGYMLDFDPATWTISYRAKSGGDMTIRLVAIEGVLVEQLPFTRQPSLRRFGEAVDFLNVFPGLTLTFVARPHSVELFRMLTTPSAPLKFVWEVDRSSDQNLSTNIEETLGQDNYRGLSPSRATETLPHNRRRFVEISHVRTELPSTLGRTRYVVEEAITGRTAWRHPVTRAKEWRGLELTYPVSVDVTVTENIVANLDDGMGYPGGPTETWNGTGYNYIPFASNQQPAWRFQTVAVPQGATIDSATIRVDVEQTGTASSNMYGENVDDAASWAQSSANGPNRMARTTESITFDGFSATGDATRTVTTLIQAIVNRAGWVSNNNLRLGCDDTSFTGTTVNFDDYKDAAGNETTLTINYTAAVVIPYQPHYQRSPVVAQ